MKTITVKHSTGAYSIYVGEHILGEALAAVLARTKNLSTAALPVLAVRTAETADEAIREAAAPVREPRHTLSPMHTIPSTLAAAAALTEKATAAQAETAAAETARPTGTMTKLPQQLPARPIRAAVAAAVRMETAALAAAVSSLSAAPNRTICPYSMTVFACRKSGTTARAPRA